MVSFSCEACGDILTKKKLDPHRNQCRGASFTCIDCMVHFWGTEYRSHTSCMSEAQKYEGALYKEKPAKKGKGKNNQAQNNQAQNSKPAPNHRAPYVEDAPDVDNPQSKTVPPSAPTPPSGSKPPAPPAATTDNAVNVFDYLVTDQTPNASKVSLAEPKEQMRMVDHAPSVFEASKALAQVQQEDGANESYDSAFEENGFSYGAGPIHPSPYQNKAPAISTEYMTPAPKKKKDRSKNQASAATSDKKRKRGEAEKLDSEVDTPMMDAPSSVQNHPGTPMLRHSGLTGGLNRMLRSPSMEVEEEHHDHPRRRYQDPSSPIKRTRRSEKQSNGSDAGSGTMKNRAERIVSSMFGGSVVSNGSGGSNEAGPKAMARTRRRSDSDAEGEVRRSKKDESRKSKRKISAQVEGDRPSRRLKQIEYEQDRPDDSGEMVVYRQPNVPDAVQREMAHHFLSIVNKGPESTRGLSINKTLKRFHKDFTDEYDGDRGRDSAGRSRADRERRGDDEKELWRTLRLKRNDRGEVVVFF